MVKKDRINCVGDRVYFDTKQRVFVIHNHGEIRYQIYPDEFCQMFQIAFKEGVLDFKLCMKGEKKHQDFELEMGNEFIEIYNKGV